MDINLKYFRARGGQPMWVWQKIRRSFAYAFALGLREEGVAAEEKVLLEKVVRLTIERDMAVPMVLFLESMGPVGFLGSQLLHALTPLLGLVCSQVELEKMARLLEKRESVFLLVEMIQKEDDRHRKKGSGAGPGGHGDTGIRK